MCSLFVSRTAAHIQTAVSKHIPVLTMKEAMARITPQLRAEVQIMQQMILNQGPIGHHKRGDSGQIPEILPDTGGHNLGQRRGGHRSRGGHHSQEIVATNTAVGSAEMLNIDNLLINARTSILAAEDASEEGSYCKTLFARARRQIRFCRAYALLNDVTHLRNKLKFTIMAVDGCIAMNPSSQVVDAGNAAKDKISAIIDQVGGPSATSKAKTRDYSNNYSNGAPAPAKCPKASPAPAPSPKCSKGPSPAPASPPKCSKAPAQAPAPAPSKCKGPAPPPAHAPCSGGGNNTDRSTEGDASGFGGFFIEHLTTDYCSSNAEIQENDVAVTYSGDGTCREWNRVVHERGMSGDQK